MTCQQWELASWIATTVGAALTVIGLGIVIIQLYLQRMQARLAALDALFSELDSHEARLAREAIYNAGSDMLRLPYLHKAANTDLRKNVENTMATFERMAYKIITRQVPSEDAFNLYGVVLLSVANKIWAYIEDQRDMRRENPLAHKLIYRRYLEAVIKEWIPQYCREVDIKPPPRGLTIKEMLDWIFRKLTEGSSAQ